MRALFSLFVWNVRRRWEERRDRRVMHGETLIDWLEVRVSPRRESE